MSKKFEFSESKKTEKYEREIRLIINVIEPDPEYQPHFISDETTFFDISAEDEAKLEARLRFYFNGELPASLSTPIWRFIELVKMHYPDWPDKWPPEH